MTADSVRHLHRLLIVDDDVDNAHVLARLFAKKFDVVQANSGEEALESARGAEPHVVIADQRMPGMSGVELLSHLQTMYPRSVRILATAYADYGPLVDAINAAGIDLYVEKPFHFANLERMVASLVDQRNLEVEHDLLLTKLRNSEQQLQRLVEERTAELARANEQLEITNAKLRELVVRDGLTNIYNHRHMLDYLEIELARSRRYGREFGLLFLDIDNFKRINDTFGHRVGDDVLVRIATLLKPADSRMRQSDFAARYGGEEFVVILPETDLRGAMVKADRIRVAAETIDWTEVHPELTSPITVSVGVAAYPQHGDQAEAVLKAADDALYAAKKAGKNRAHPAD